MDVCFSATNRVMQEREAVENGHRRQVLILTHGVELLIGLLCGLLIGVYSLRRRKMPAPKGNQYALGNEGGRPRIYDDEKVKEIIEKLEKYIEENEIPILVEFCVQNRIERDAFYEYEELSTVRNRCLWKKEAAIERKGLNNEINVNMGKFSLSQMGWYEKKQVKGDIDQNIVITIDGLEDEEDE